MDGPTGVSRSGHTLDTGHSGQWTVAMVTDRALNTTPLQPVSQVPVRPVTPGHAHPTPRQAVHGGQCSQDTRPAVRPSGLHSGVKCLSESWTDTSQSRTEGQLTAARCVLQVSGSPYHTHTHTHRHREVTERLYRHMHVHVTSQPGTTFTGWVPASPHFTQDNSQLAVSHAQSVTTARLSLSV